MTSPRSQRVSHTPKVRMISGLSRRALVLQFPAKAGQHSLGPSSERLIGGEIGPDGATLAGVFAAAGLGLGKAPGNFNGQGGFQFLEPLVNLVQKHRVRISPVQ